MIIIPIEYSEVLEVLDHSFEVQNIEHGRGDHPDFFSEVQKRYQGYLAEYAIWKYFFNKKKQFGLKINQGNREDVGLFEVKSTNNNVFHVKRSLCTTFPQRRIIVCRILNIRDTFNTKCEILGCTTLGYLIQNARKAYVAEILGKPKEELYKCYLPILDSLSEDSADTSAYEELEYIKKECKKFKIEKKEVVIQSVFSVSKPKEIQSVFNVSRPISSVG